MESKKMIFLVFVMLCFSGCTILSNLDEISALQGYSKEKDGQNQLVKSINARYDVLNQSITNGAIKNYKDKDSFTKAFGEPILKKDLGHGSERWLYRYAIYRMARDKVYVYFDHDGHLVRWEKLPCPKFL